MMLAPDYLALIPTSGTEVIPANPAQTKMAFARVGYSLEPAIADLIDNSIDAAAKDVLIRFVYDRKGVQRVFIVDNGNGMSELTLSKAMAFGSELPHKQKDLGKYGIGLKAASFSQCKAFSVISSSNGEIAGRRWSNKATKGDWLCEKLDPISCRELVSAPWATLDVKEKGTIVIWDELTGLKSGQSGPEDTVNRSIDSLTTHLGIVFHRFLEAEKIKIHLSSQFAGKVQSHVVSSVNALDPFSYQKSGAQGYPKQFELSVETVGKIVLDAHIWPPKTKEPGYKLGGGKVASRQGFYFYRNGRLIQAGGWNGMRDDDGEPHLSLARVSVDLPPNIDVSIQKDKVDNLPREFIDAVRQSSSASTRFADYIKKAQEIYRSKNNSDEQEDFPLIPRGGFGKHAIEAVKKHSGLMGKRVRTVNFRWSKLQAGTLFKIEREKRCVLLNELYRKSVLAGKRRSTNDAQLFKMALYLLLVDFLDYPVMNKGRLETIDRYNHYLMACLDDE
jgi:hypothetical protein